MKTYKISGNRTRCGLVALSLGFLSMGVANATVVMIDFGTSTSAVEPGFVAQTTGAATTYSTDGGDITVASTGSFFNRSAGTVSSPSTSYTAAPLYGDFTFLNSFGTLTLTIDGAGILASTDYDITFYSYDSQHTQSGGTVTYTGVSGTTGSTSIAYSSNNIGGAGNSSLSTWTSNGSGQIVIDVTGTTEGPRVNGMAITVVPEPSTALLGGLGALMLMRRRRR